MEQQENTLTSRRLRYCLIGGLALLLLPLLTWLVIELQEHGSDAPSRLLMRLVEWDKWLMVHLNGKGEGHLNAFWYIVSDKMTWIPLSLAAIIGVWRVTEGSWRKKLAFLVVLALCITVFDQVSSSIIKPLVCRLRPSHDPTIMTLLHYVDGYHGGQYGFVSGHATNIAGVCTWLFLIQRHTLTRIVLVLFALAMGYSRIYLGVHFPGDVICGYMLGIALALLGYYLANKFFTVHDARRPTLLLLVLALTLLYIIVRAAFFPLA